LGQGSVAGNAEVVAADASDVDPAVRPRGQQPATPAGRRGVTPVADRRASWRDRLPRPSTTQP